MVLTYLVEHLHQTDGMGGRAFTIVDVRQVGNVRHMVGRINILQYVWMSMMDFRKTTGIRTTPFQQAGMWTRALRP